MAELLIQMNERWQSHAEFGMLVIESPYDSVCWIDKSYCLDAGPRSNASDT